MNDVPDDLDDLDDAESAPGPRATPAATPSPAPKPKRESAAERKERLAERVRTLPQDPGCYIMKDRRGEVFYVGKATNLRARVRSYFSGSDTRQFVAWLDELLHELEYVVVHTEKEALLLERTLVKQHQPRFNVKLRDDKNFIHLKLEVRPAAADARLRRRYPRVEVVRGPAKDGARTFGPFHSATSVRQTLRVLNRHFQLRTCKDSVFENRTRPCLQHQIGRCPAPCVRPVDDYADRVTDAALFLSGRTAELENRLRGRMLELSAQESFELAARARDQLLAVSDSLDDQVVTDVGRSRDVDLLAAARKGSLLEIVRVIVKDGRMQGTERYPFDRAEFPTEELVLSLATQLYLPADAPSDGARSIPDEVLLSLPALSESPETAALADALSDRKGRRVVVRVPQRGHDKRLLEIAQKNAEANMEDTLRKKDTREKGLETLQQRLALPMLPRVIECFDISLFQGKEPVASQVCFVDGAPDKSRYRRYNIKTVEGTDDFAMLYEALTRRLKRGLVQGDLPDLLIVDGGKGQLNVALAACKDLNVPVGVPREQGGVYLASIAKARTFSDARPKTPRERREVRPTEDDLAMSPERLFVPGNKDPLILRPHTADRFLVEQLRDEAHRFAITAHRARRKKRTLRSALDDVAGIGTEKRRALLKAFGSLPAIREAPLEAVAAVVGPKLAARVQAALRALDGSEASETADPSAFAAPDDSAGPAELGADTGDDEPDPVVEELIQDLDADVIDDDADPA